MVLEIDENQHAGIADHCEIERMLTISLAQKVPYIFIRLNPDAFVDAEGIKRDPSQADRSHVLKLVLDTARERTLTPDEPVLAIYLYYNGSHRDNCFIEVLTYGEKNVPLAELANRKALFRHPETKAILHKRSADVAFEV